MKDLRSVNKAIIFCAGLLLLASCARDKGSPKEERPSARATGSPETAPAASAKGAAKRSPASAETPSAASLTVSSSSAPGAKLSIEPKVVERGSPCLFTLTVPDALSSLDGSLMGKKVFFNSDQSRKTWYGLAGIGLESALGGQPLTLKGSDANGHPVAFNAHFEIEARKANIRVPPEFTNPDDEDRARIARDAILKRGAFKTLSTMALWDGPFLRPVDPGVRLTAVFSGTRRFNSGPVKVHRGVDFGAPQGTPIKAINNGRVILARNMFYDGNLVAIDHGQGLLSLYLHLSRMDVKEGDPVSAGQPIGLSGSTGRSSGPHLHLQIKWAGTDIDPQELMALRLPSNLVKND